MTPFADVNRRIADACERAGVDRDSVHLVVVSKTQSDDAVREVYDLGQRVFAENREQGLRARDEAGLPDDIDWHFVGPLQSRKVKSVSQRCVLLQSLDRPKLARLWGDHSTVPALIQFNLAAEPQKSGYAPHDADQVIDEVLEAGVPVRGVMAIPPVADDPHEVRPWFALLYGIYERYRERYPGIEVCSMGMTDDFEVAIEEGSNMVRIGRAIFPGQRA